MELKELKKLKKQWTEEEIEVIRAWIDDNNDNDLKFLKSKIPNKSSKLIKEKIDQLKTQPKRKKVVIRNQKKEKSESKPTKPEKSKKVLKEKKARKKRNGTQQTEELKNKNESSNSKVADLNRHIHLTSENILSNTALPKLSEVHNQSSVIHLFNTTSVQPISMPQVPPYIHERFENPNLLKSKGICPLPP